MADEPRTMELPQVPDLSALSIPATVGQAYACRSCGTLSLPLATLLHNSKNGELPLKLRGAVPDPQTISRWLRPPDVPIERAPPRRDIWGSPFALAIVFFVILLATIMLAAILGYMFAAPIGVFALIFATHAVRRTSARPVGSASSPEHERALALRAWDRRMEVWERLAVCPTCGLLADPATGRSAEWHSVPSLFV